MDKQLSPYEEKQYTYGRVWTALLLMMMLAVPLAICVYYNAWPPLTPGNTPSTIAPPSSSTNSG